MPFYQTLKGAEAVRCCFGQSFKAVGSIVCSSYLVHPLLYPGLMDGMLSADDCFGGLLLW